MNHCQHFAEVPEAKFILCREGKPDVQLCDACAEACRLLGEDVRKIEGYLWGFPIVFTKPGENEGIYGSFTESPLEGTNIAKQFKVTCWLCDDNDSKTIFFASQAVCECHNRPPGSPPKPCNLVCRS